MVALVVVDWEGGGGVVVETRVGAWCWILLSITMTLPYPRHLVFRASIGSWPFILYTFFLI